MTKAGILAKETLDKLIAWDSLKEMRSPGLETFHPIIQAVSGDQIGCVRVFHGERIRKLVNISLAVAPAGLDSHMIFAFTDSASAAPHFTLDAVAAGPSYAFHLDLIPKTDLGANLNYLNTCYKPLVEHFNKANAIEGLVPAQLSPLQLAVMSPLMLAKRASAPAFEKISEPVTSYLNHWQSLLVNNDIIDGKAAFPGCDFAKRDRDNREVLFNPEIDPVWGQIEKFIGPETGSMMRRVLKNTAMESF
tara:strand:- start:696 stop:1439 length:744 start_codon:yes stop_codon:yes gene_type:complete